MCNTSERQIGHFVPGCLTSKSRLFQLRDGADIMLKEMVTGATLGLRKALEAKLSAASGKREKFVLNLRKSSLRLLLYRIRNASKCMLFQVTKKI